MVEHRVELGVDLPYFTEESEEPAPILNRPLSLGPVVLGYLQATDLVRHIELKRHLREFIWKRAERADLLAGGRDG